MILNLSIPLWLKAYWQHSQIFAFLDRLAQWQQHSSWVGIGLLGSLLVGLLGLLPYLSNNQSGLMTISIAIIWVLIWLGDTLTGQALKSPLHLPLICYWGIATLATLLSPVRRDALEGWIKLSLYLLMFASMSRVLSTSTSNFLNGRLNWRSLLVGSYLVTSLLVGVYGLRQWFFGAEELATWTDPTSDLAGTTRVYSFLGNPNLLAGYLLPAIPLGAIAMIVWRSWSAKCVGALVAIFSLLCVRETYSRGGLYGLYAEILALVILLIYWWSGSQRLPKWAIPGFIVGTVGVLVANILLVPSQRTRFFSSFLGRADSSANFRLNVWASVLEMIKARPILGIGNGNRAFNKIYPFFQRPGYSALGTYSVPLEITVETGIVGLVLYLWFVVTAVRHGWQQLNYARQQQQAEGLWIIGAFSVIAGMISHGLVDTVWFRPQVQILWWLAIALIASFNTLTFNSSDNLSNTPSDLEIDLTDNQANEPD
ncbi:putative bicarbonate transporter, IctB family [Synechococcus sp. PCC 7502]|uniref:IctB family putative bicarbonate transporter n=1 Tax=Synechococcus sp. PCC 7502 TaxID=1173263 RepID=UPI00029F84B8|nr:IctB family putative bicarbonate transporter [Synechococcus sp. PCC 7502]AFY75109.1 putative bicarbonate transporter, IctB family [Synechococcus sp. PCC 7502]